MNNVVIYSTPTCGYCNVAKQYFQENNIAYTEKDVSVDQEALKAMVEKTGQMGVPVIEVNGEASVGFNKNRLAQALGLA